MIWWHEIYNLLILSLIMSYLHEVLGDVPDLSDLLLPTEFELEMLHSAVSNVQERDESLDPEMRLRSYMIAAQKSPDFFSLADFVEEYDLDPEKSVSIMASRDRLSDIRCNCHNSPEALALWQQAGNLVKMAPGLEYPVPKDIAHLIDDMYKRFDWVLVELYQSARDVPAPFRYRVIDSIAGFLVPIITFISSKERHYDMLANEQKVQRIQAKLAVAESALLHYLAGVNDYFTVL